MLKYFFIICYIAFLLSGIEANSKNKPIFSILPEEQDYLRYYLLTNQFDSARVFYYFGEIRVENSQNQQLITLNHSLDTFDEQAYKTPSVNGINTKLQQICKSQTFTIPKETTTISFFRQLSETTNRSVSSIGFSSYPSSWDITDRTEFVIQLVRASDNFPLLDLDSVGCLPNVNPNSDTRYGTNFKRVFVIREIPEQLEGEEVYIDISPRRWGPTKSGIVVNETKSWVTRSSIYDNFGILYSKAVFDSLYSEAWEEVSQYADSCLAGTKSLPNTSYFIPANFIENFANRYLMPRLSCRIISGDTVWYSDKLQNETTEEQSKNKKFQPSSVESGKQRVFIYPQPNPSVDRNVYVNLITKAAMHVSISIETIKGENPQKIWTGIIKMGNNSILTNLHSLPPGDYVIIVRDYHENRLCLANISLI